MLRKFGSFVVIIAVMGSGLLCLVPSRPGWHEAKWGMSATEVLASVPYSAPITKPFNDRTPMRWILYDDTIKVKLEHFSLRGQPCLVDFDFGIDDKLREVNIFVREPTSRFIGDVADSLIEKYGKPTHNETKIYSDGSGETVKMTWSLPETIITIDGLETSNLDETGLLHIIYQAGTKYSTNQW